MCCVLWCAPWLGVALSDGMWCGRAAGGGVVGGVGCVGVWFGRWGVFPFSFPAPVEGCDQGRGNGPKKDMCVAWLGKKGPGCRNPGRVRLDLEILPCVLWGKGPPEGAGIQAGCGSI